MGHDTPNRSIPSSPITAPATIGFGILSHRDPPQLLRLVDRLSRLYPGAPIAIHHDEDQCPLSEGTRASLARFARLVTPHCRTRWGRWSLVDATIRALAPLLDSPNPPAWITLLSASDYPIKPAATVLSELASWNADAFIEARPVSTTGPCEAHTRTLRKRYLRQTIWLGDAIPALARTRISIPAAIGRRIGPFCSRGKGLTLHWGPQWFTCTSRVAEAIVDSPRTHPRLWRWMRHTHIPDEAFIHTLIMNNSGFSVIPSNRRFIRWRDADAKSPETLTLADLNAIVTSDAHFARKFNAEDPVLDQLDRLLGL
jgi:hypothetical protein